MELAFAGLHQLCAPMLDRLGRLPDPQRDALSAAFGLKVDGPPDRFLVGLAVLSLLDEVAGDTALVCLVDDAEWLDQVSAQTLAFVARRLLAERIALVFAARAPGDTDELAGLPELVVGGLGDNDARALLDSVIQGPVDERVRDRIVAETRGNPLALTELTSALTPAELAGGFGLPDARPLTSRIEQSYVRRLHSLPADAELLVLTAAAEPLGDATLLWRAADRLGITAGAAPPAADAGLIEIGARVRFPHPLVRSAAYRAASPAERQRVHGALADATDRVLDPDRCAWHRAARGDHARRRGRVRARALGGSRPGARRPGGSRRVPATRRRPHARSGATRGARADGGAGDARRRRARRRGRSADDGPAGRRRRPPVRARSSCARDSRSPRAAGATLPHCC